MQIFEITLGFRGDPFNKVHMSGADAVSYPEMLVLMTMHGEENITNITCIRDEPRDPRDERIRLASVYSEDNVRMTLGVPHMPIPEGSPQFTPPGNAPATTSNKTKTRQRLADAAAAAAAAEPAPVAPDPFAEPAEGAPA